MPTNPRLFEYHTVNAFPRLTFERPVSVKAPLGEANRLFIVEHPGRIVIITNLTLPTYTIFLDLSNRVLHRSEAGLLDLAFHPRYRSNGWFYVCYNRRVIGDEGEGMKTQLSRFQVDPNDPNAADAASEVTILSQWDESEDHNGGQIDFGPDGYLYVAIGDEGSGWDYFANGQRIDKDFFSGILRLDVDQRPASLAPSPHLTAEMNYRVPPDNPFVGTSAFRGLPVDPARVRTEFYAVGLRNPWRFSFDPLTGSLYCGDTGQQTREEINRITSGGNYGWPVFEGTAAGPRWSAALNSTEFSVPLSEYGREQGGAIAAGFVYRGQAYPQLDGSYLLSDFVSGYVGRVRLAEGGVSGPEWFLWENGVVSIGLHPASGAVLLADYEEGVIKQLVPAPDPAAEPVPETLSATGAFLDLAQLVPSPELVPYEINVPFWSDHADKRRWVAVPRGRTLGFQSDGPWYFPPGTVWVKHFEMEMTRGAPASSRRLETRLLTMTDFGIPYGVTYRWNAAQTDAVLVPWTGESERFTVQSGVLRRPQTWTYPGPPQCAQCHTFAGGGALGFTTAQLNREIETPAGRTNQLLAFQAAGLVAPDAGLDAIVHTLPALAPLTDETSSVEWRVRSYLEANCAQCHQKDGPAWVPWDARTRLPLFEAGIVEGLVYRQLGDPLARIVQPGSLPHSILYRRLASLTDGRMPPLGSSLVDTQAVALIGRWVTNDLAAWKDPSAWQDWWFGDRFAALSEFSLDPDRDGLSNAVEYVLGTSPRRAEDAWRPEFQVRDNAACISFTHVANRRFEVQWTTNLADAAGWRPVNHPANRPRYPAQTQLAEVVHTPLPAATVFYRVLIFAP
jgi:uncharacterized repeat protein (TIGR03806 family)